MKTVSPIRVITAITATAIFDGHDVSINIIRKLLQDKGMEVIHLGHNSGRSVFTRWVLCMDALRDENRITFISSAEYLL